MQPTEYYMRALAWIVMLMMVSVCATCTVLIKNPDIARMPCQETGK